MDMQRVNSDQLHAIGFNEKGLAAQFRCRCSKGGSPNEHCPVCRGNGHAGTYFYPGAPKEIHDKLMEAHAKGESVGALFNQLVRRNKDFKFQFES